MEARRSPSESRTAVDLELCRIERWRGYATSSFYVQADDATLFESRAFRWRRKDAPPDTGAARAAYDALVEQLVAAGWTEHAPGATWYETTFSRPAPRRRPAERAPAPAPAPEVVVAPEAPPEPEPVVAAPAPPPAARVVVPAPPSAPRPRRRWPYVAGACVAVLAAVLGVLATRGGSPSKPAARPPAAKPHATARKVVQAAPPAAAPHGAATVDVVIRAVRDGGSWVELRRGSSTGKVLFAGSLAPGGRMLHFSAPRLWARFGAAANLAITVDGKPLALQGTFDKVFTARRR